MTVVGVDDAQTPSEIELPMETQEGVSDLPGDVPQSTPQDRETSADTGRGGLYVADGCQKLHKGILIKTYVNE